MESKGSPAQAMMHAANGGTGKTPSLRYSQPGYKVGRNATRFYFTAFIVLVGISLILFLPLELPFAVKSYAKLVPSQEWVLEKGRDGQLMESTFNYETGNSDGYRVSHFERGSSINFSFHPSITPGGTIVKGDTIGSILSSEVQERLISLQGDLATAKSSLAVMTSGEKTAIVQEAQRRLQFAEKRLDEHSRALARAEKLFSEDLISRQSLEEEQGQAKLLSLEVSIAESHLRATQTGEKPEQLGLIQARIAALADEIKAIHARTASYTLTAPISGRILRDYSPTTLLTISDQRRYVVLVPVKWEDYFHVSQMQNARIELKGFPGPVVGTVVSLDREIEVLNGVKVVMLTAILDPSEQNLMPGMLAKCKIECNPVTPLEYVKRLLASLIA